MKRSDLSERELEFLQLLAQHQDTGTLISTEMHGIRVNTMHRAGLVTGDWRITPKGRAVIPEHAYSLQDCDGCGGKGGRPSRQFLGATLLCGTCNGFGKRYQPITPATESAF
ncbi:hypothetical protein [Azospirillum canadense]|uniref:hypothetical protein n=1 Tax=Azospirillum canadense TaxID=403962 RepID=UPI0022263214|nr:hypothetical protein [Azospirillum canadense]MCW2242232.1 DnaJ-class molecular chaperone [Azospirillum canadense]